MKKQDMNRDWIATARTLSEALPYLQRYTEAIVVIKLGGHAMTSDQGMETFARDVALMRQVGINPIIVHGGGPMINAMLEKLNIESNFIEEVSDLDIRFMHKRNWYEKWPINPVTERTIPTLIKLEFKKSGKEYIWIIEPNIDLSLIHI